MKFLTLLFFLFIAVSCTRKIVVVDPNTGSTITREFKTKEIQEVSTITDQTISTSEETVIESCSTPGVCCKCGFTIQMEHECSCSYWRNCPGKETVNYRVLTESIHQEYKIKTESSSLSTTLKSPQSQRVRREVISKGSCS